MKIVNYTDGLQEKYINSSLEEINIPLKHGVNLITGLEKGKQQVIYKGIRYILTSIDLERDKANNIPIISLKLDRIKNHEIT